MYFTLMKGIKRCRDLLANPQLGLAEATAEALPEPRGLRLPIRQKALPKR